MLCPQCQHENPTDARFCNACGSPLPRPCHACGHENPPEAKFCNQCGTFLAGHPLASPPSQTEQQPAAPVEAPPAEPHTPDAERRQLTILFTDLVDSTKLSSQLDAEDYREIVHSYQSTCAEVIERFDCHLAQTLGDGLLVYSGYPVAHENDAERAVRTGLGILDAMKTLNERLDQDKGVRLSIRVGIHTGLVVVGDVGAGTRQEQLALGEVPNVASRLQGLAAPDTVVISNATYRLIQGYFACEPLGEHDLRGVTEPIAVYRVLHESGAQSRLEIAGAHGLTPLVGRESESTLLFERWEQAKGGHGQVILLSGEAGIGKSRLVQVLKDHVAEGTHTRLECRSVPYFTNSALYPIIDMVQRTLRFQVEDTPETKFEKLEHNLSQYRLSMDETAPLFATLLSLPVPEDRYPPLNLSPQRQRQKTLEAIVAIILELSERQLVLFILEDLHWTDPTTLELLDLLLDQIPTASIYTLLTCRPGFQSQWSNRSYLTQVTLNRLSRTQIEGMAERVAGGKHLPEEVLPQIIEKTDGVPLFVEEMTKAVLESGYLKEVDGHYELTGSLTSLAIPATLQDSLMARLDRLVTAKAIAQYASVIGRQFSYALLREVSQLDEATLQRELSRLVEAELIYQRGLPPQATYVFKHALIQDTAYESLLRSTRQQYHQRIAQTLKERFSEMVASQPELLAYHYTEAGLGEPAIVAWQRAGHQASQRSAYKEAIGHLTQGLALLTRLPDTEERVRAELALQAILGPVLMATKGQASPEVDATYTRAYALCQQVPDAPQHFPVLRGLWNVHLFQGNHRTAQELGERLFALAQRQQNPAFLPWGYTVQGLVLFYRGTFASAYEQFAQGMRLYNPEQYRAQAFAFAQNPGVVCQAFGAYALWFLGYPEQALRQSEAALRQAQVLPSAFHQATALNFTSRLYHYCRDVQAALGRSETLVALSSEHGFPVWLAQGQLQRGWALSMQGEGIEGLRQLQEGLALWRASGSGLWLPYALSLLAEAYGKTRQTDEGLTVLTEALTLVDKTEERFWEAELYRLKAELFLQQSSNNATEAETCFHQALDVARHQQAKSLELRTATSLARLWQSQDKRQDAYDLLAPVYGWFTEGFDTADLQEAKALLEALA
jgi:predicted ATPase/class 3 adenylate cyclase